MRKLLNTAVVASVFSLVALVGPNTPAASATSYNTKPITYITNPHYSLAVAGTGSAALAAQFPTPSQCVAKFGLACYTPALIRKGYNVPSTLTGAGQTIVIVDAFGSPTIRHDLHVFDLIFGLPDPTLNIIFPGGSPTFNPLQSHGEIGWAFETSLDVEWAHAIAPGATIDLVVAATNSGNVLNLAQQFAVTHHLGNVMSLSFGVPEIAVAGKGNNFQLMQADAIYHAAQAAGITVFAASGDAGANFGLPITSALFPASDPLVTGVGGTNLFLSDAGAYLGETVWNDSIPSLCPFGCNFGAIGATGGAPSRIFPAPTFQHALTGQTMRSTSDVGYNASVYTGILVFESFFHPGLYFIGGTSEGAPQWAAITALADQAAGHSLGFLNPVLYAIAGNAAQYAADFHDITVGSNGFFGPGFPALTGYDLPTGLGTPNVAHLISTIGH